MLTRSTSLLCIVFNSLEIGGIERKIIDLVHHYSNHPQVKVILFLKSYRGKFINKLPPQVKLMYLSASPIKFHNLIFPFWLVAQFARHNPNLILSFGNYSSICAIIANLLSVRTNLIISEDSSIDLQLQSDSYPTIRKFLVKLTYPLASKIIVLTESAKQKISQFVDPSKIIILNNWLPISLPSPSQNTKRDNDILFVGRLVPQKDPLKFLNICHQLLQKNPTLKITMIGEGPLLPQVKKFITQHSLSIKLLPADSDVTKYYQSSKILLLTSNHEGFPLTILEAFYNSCPTISPSLPEITPFYSKNPEVFLYKNEFQAIKLIETALKKYSIISRISQGYSKYVASNQQQNFNATLKYIESYL